MLRTDQTRRQGALDWPPGRPGFFCLPPAPPSEPPKTIKPGKLTVGLNGDMPMTQLKDGQLIGTDGELMVSFAKQLGLEPDPTPDGLGRRDRGDQAGPARPHAWSMGWPRRAPRS